MIVCAGEMERRAGAREWELTGYRRIGFPRANDPKAVKN